jgi:hypothetical protein
MNHLKMENHMNNARSARTPMLPELFIGNKNSLLLSQVQVNNQVNNHSTLGNKYLRHQPPLSNDAKTITSCQSTMCQRPPEGL